MELRVRRRPPRPRVSFATPGLPVFVTRPEQSCFIVTRLCGLPRRDSRRAPQLGRETAVIRGLRFQSDLDIVEASWTAATADGAGAQPSNDVPGVLRTDDDYADDQFAYDDFEAADEDDDEEADDDDDADDVVDDLEEVELEEQDDDIIAKVGFNIEDDDDIDSQQVSSRGRRRSSILETSGFSPANVDAEDDLNDEDELLEVDTGGIQLGSVPSATKPPTPSEDDDDIPEPDMLTEEEFEDPTEEELQSAAELLTGSGLLGLTTNQGEDDSLRLAFADDPKSDEADDASLPGVVVEEPVQIETTKTPSKKRKASTSPLSKSRELRFDVDDDEVDSSKGRELRFDVDDDEDDSLDLPPPDALEDDTPRGLDHYSDREEEEEAEFTIMSKTEGSFGRVWELNEDSYVTVTQAGQTYAYEMDEADLDDQEMSSQVRGAKGGWGKGLQHDAANKFTPGTREWIARRSYDLIAQASARDMKLWTKRGHSPPTAIDELYEQPPALVPAPLGKATLKQSMPSSNPAFAVSPLGGAGAGDAFGAVREGDDADGADADVDADARSALERAVKFPCSFKFKVEGSGGDALIESLRRDVRYVMGQQLDPGAFITEPAGRYLRVSFFVDVATAKHVTDLYDAFRVNPLVKFSYG